DAFRIVGPPVWTCPDCAGRLIRDGCCSNLRNCRVCADRRLLMSTYDQNSTPSGAIDRRAVAIDAGLRAYMLRIYNNMAAGVGLTALVAWLTYQLTGPALLQSPLMWVFILAPLVLVFVISSRINTLSVRTARWLFFVYAALVGVSLSSLLHIY